MFLICVFQKTKLILKGYRYDVKCGGRQVIKLVVDSNRLSLFIVLTFAFGATALVACGGQSSPVLQTVSPKQEQRTDVEVLNARATSSIRSSSAEDSDIGGGAASKRIEVFTSRLEALTLQKGGVAKIVLPLSSDENLRARLRSVSFVSESSGLKESSVQGRTLNLVVAEDAAEGRHDGKVVVRFDNGSEFAQPISITVLP